MASSALAPHLLSAAVFLTVVLSVLGIAGLARPGSLRDRLKGAPAAHGGQTSIRVIGGGWLGRVLHGPVEQKVVPQGQERSTVRRQLIRAGFMEPAAVPLYFAARLALAVGLPIGFAALSPLLLAGGLDRDQLIAGSFGLLGIGYMLPATFLSRRVRHRQLAVREGFPDAMDLLLICVEAGLGLDAAVARVGDEIGKAYPILGQHFRLMGLELRAGQSREEALRNFADRIGVDEVGGLASLLIQSEQLGASIADTLRAASDDMRSRRMLQAEHMAQELGVKLSFPLILMIMPALMIVIGTPAIIQLSRSIMPLFSSMD